MRSEFERILYDFQRSHKLGEKSTERLLKALVGLAERVDNLKEDVNEIRGDDR